MVLFNLNNKESLKDIKEKYQIILRRYPRDEIALIFIGTKCDLKDEREVSKEEIEEFVKSTGIQYIETSSKDNINVEFSYQEIIKEYKRNYPLKKDLILLQNGGLLMKNESKCLIM